MKSILLVEDDPAVAEVLSGLLLRHGYRVDISPDARTALRRFREADLILLDLGLPDIDGIELCRQLRSVTQVPIIAVTARSQEVDKVLALRMGADDYVVKPFGFQELLARIEAVLRRSNTTDRPIDRLEIDMASHRVWADGVEVFLARKEFAILALLVEQPGHVVGRARILRAVWGEGWDDAHRTLDVHISSLRSKLGIDGLIQVVRGIGYRLRMPADNELPET